MRRSRALWFPIAAAVTGAAALLASPASASTGYFTLQGLSSGPFVVTGQAVTDSYQGYIQCTWDSGANAFAGVCTTASGNEAINGNFVQIGTRQEMIGVIGPGPITGNFNGVCSTAAITRPPTLYWDTDCHFTVH
jgi:hypothetical protein